MYGKPTIIPTLDTKVVDIYIDAGWSIDNWLKKHNIPGFHIWRENPEYEGFLKMVGHSQYVIWDTSKLKIVRRHAIKR